MALQLELLLCRVSTSMYSCRILLPLSLFQLESASRSCYCGQLLQGVIKIVGQAVCLIQLLSLAVCHVLCIIIIIIKHHS